MPLRSILLRVLFWSLALAAVFGAFGVLFSSGDALWRVAATSAVTSGAALLLLLASSQMDKPAARPAALLGATLIVVEYVLMLAATWELVERWTPRYDDSLWLTVLFLALVGLPAVAFLRMSANALTAVAGRIGLVVAGVELALLLVVAWDQSRWSVNWVLAELAAWFPLYAALALICLVGQGVPPRRFWRWIGVAAAAAGFCGAAYGAIRSVHQGGEALVYVTCVAGAVAHANIVMLLPLRPAQAWLRWLTLAAGVGTALFVGLATYSNSYGDGMAPRLAAACGIIAGCGTLALAVLARLNRQFVVPPDAVAGVSEVTLVCPLCRRKQTVPLGGASCAGCRVRILVRVEEPKCAACGYSLLMLQSDACPECGTPVPAAAAPAGPSAEPVVSV